ncbi:MAG TPA: GGDEF domain-containing protein [Thermoleophilaceae bacterium]|jgi:diguanylate cyclase (GGDEF)-like protein
MDPSVFERLGLRPSARPQGRERAERAVAARSLMYLFLVGAIVAGAALAAHLSPAVDSARIAVTAGGALAIAIALFFAYEAIPRWALSVFLLMGSMLIEWAVYASRDPQSPFLLFYLWIAFYAFYFLTRTQAILQMAFVGMAYAAVLERSTEAIRTSILRWIVFTIAMIVAGLLVRMLRERIDHLLRELDTASRTDMLTGLLDERGWDEILHKELERARRSGNRVGIVVGQIDGESPLSDELGERRADELVSEIGQLLGRTIRLNDEAARVGAEQFAVVCPYTDERGATIMAERAGSLVRERESDEPRTISFGIVSYPKHGTSVDALMQAARHALSEARGLGGDRAVSFFSTGDSIEERLRSDVDIEVVAADYN